MSSSISIIAPQTVAWATDTKMTDTKMSVGQRDSHAARLEKAGDDSPRRAGRLEAEVQDRYDAAHQQLVAPRFQIRQSQGTSIVRQRFYPAQLRRLLNLDLISLSAPRKHRLTWVGWDRSLPRLYLPVEPLLRLVIEAVDGITRQPAQSMTPASIRLRVECQRMANATLVVGLDADQWLCDAKFRGALNARWFRTGSQAHLWQRLARQCDTVGGWLSVANLPGGGASLLINLPTDQPRALVHSWLSRKFASHPSSTVSLYAIGRSRIETVEELRAANIRLQSLSRSEDYIYRTCHGRWIWLTTAADLPAFLQTAPWQSEQLDRWTCAHDSGAIIDLAGRIDARFRELMGTRIPPLDLRTHALMRDPVNAHRPNTRVDQAVQVSPANHLNSHAKWRYPI